MSKTALFVISIFFCNTILHVQLGTNPKEKPFLSAAPRGSGPFVLLSYWIVWETIIWIILQVWIEVHHTCVKWRQLICDVRDPRCAVAPCSNNCTASQCHLPSDNTDILKGTHRLQVKWPSDVLPSHGSKFGIDAASDLSLKQSWDVAERDTACRSS